MKKFLNIAIVAAMALGASSCTKSSDIGGGSEGDVTGSGKKITFTLPAKQGNLSYAEIATDDEKTLDMSDTRIYMFDNDTKKMEAVLTGTDFRSASKDDKVLVTIEIPEEWEGDKKFYFIGNASAADANMPDLDTEFTETQMLALTTGTMSDTHLATPLLLTGISPVINDIQTAPSTVPGDVELYRSVARFDISNDVDANNVEIKKVLFEKVTRATYVFVYHRTGTTTNYTYILPEIDVDAAVSGKQEQESLFYLYPTNIKADGTGSRLLLIGEVNGEEKVFSLRPQDSNGSYIDFSIQPNKRYLISAVDPENLTFSLIVADWDEGEEIVGQPEDGLGSTGLVIGSGVLTDGTTTVDAGFTFTVASTGAEFSFDVKSSSLTGVETDVIPAVSEGFESYGDDKITVTTITETSITYAVPYYKTTVTVTIDESAIESNDNFLSVIQITDKGTGKVSEVKVFHVSDDISDPTNVFYPGTMLKPVRLTYTPEEGQSGEGVVAYFAPVNVGATEIGNNFEVKHVGYLFQWGRNVPFDWHNFNSVLSSGMTFEEAMSTEVFIGVGTGVNNVDWLTPHDSGLWSGQNAQGPCPIGWRMPTANEIRAIRYAEFSYDESAEMYTFSGDNDGEKLYMPVKGRIGNTGNAYTDYARYWVGEANSNGYQSYILTLYKDGRENPLSLSATAARTFGVSVRCVLDIQE